MDEQIRIVRDGSQVTLQARENFSPLIVIFDATDTKIHSAMEWLKAGGLDNALATPPEQPAGNTPLWKLPLQVIRELIKAGEIEPPPFYSDVGVDDAPEAVTETGASQTVEGHLQINDMSETWDWGPGDWVEFYVSQIGSLRAEVATVTAERKAALTLADAWLEEIGKFESALAAEEKRVELVRERRDYWHNIAEEWVKKFDRSQDALAAEREAHERTREAHAILLQAASDALADEEWYADELATFMSGLRYYIDPNMPHADETRDGLAAWVDTHDARRAEKGADGE